MVNKVLGLSNFINQVKTVFVMCAVWVVVVRLGVKVGVNYFSSFKLMLMHKETLIGTVNYKKRREKTRYYFLHFEHRHNYSKTIKIVNYKGGIL